MKSCRVARRVCEGFLLCAFLVMTVIGCGESSADIERRVAGSPPSQRVTVEELLYDYYNNEVRAELRFTNEIIEISGYVLKVDKYGSGYEVLMGEDVFMGKRIRCFFSGTNVNREAIAQINPGSYVAIKGYCLGMTSWREIKLEGCQPVR